MRLSRLEVLTLVFVISVHLLAFLSSFLQFSNPPKKIEDVLQAELIPPPQTTQPEKKNSRKEIKSSTSTHRCARKKTDPEHL